MDLYNRIVELGAAQRPSGAYPTPAEDRAGQELDAFLANLTPTEASELLPRAEDLHRYHAAESQSSITYGCSFWAGVTETLRARARE